MFRSSTVIVLLVVVVVSCSGSKENDQQLGSFSSLRVPSTKVYVRTPYFIIIIAGAPYFTFSPLCGKKFEQGDTKESEVSV